MQKKLLLFFILILSLSMLFGQGSERPKQDDAWIKKTYRKGMKSKRGGKFEKSLKQFQRIIEKHPDYLPAHQQKASVLYSMGKVKSAAQSLEDIIAIDSSYNVEIYFDLGKLNEELLQREKALSAYRTYLDKSNPSTKKHAKALQKSVWLDFVIIAMENPVPFDPQDPGPGINSSNHEYLAMIDITGREMVFTRRINRQEDLFYSYYNGQKWAKAQAIDELNSPNNEAAHALSPDGRYLYFTFCENSRTLGSCDIFISKRVGKKWTRPENLGAPLNSSSWDSQPVISADGNTMYFSSTRPGGLGGRDIWYSKKARSDQWTKPVNLGETINTPGNEESPFLHPDGIHLYFMSDGHLGMGGFDLFLAEKTTEAWSKPQNLGYPINTEADEGAIRVAPDGKTAFMSSDRQDIRKSEKPNLNIFSFELAEHLQAYPVNYLEGLVRDKITLETLEVDLRLFDNLSGNWVSDQTTDADGSFLFALPSGKNYNLSIAHPGYVFYSNRFELDSLAGAYDPIKLIIELIPLVEEVSGEETSASEIILKNVFFESGSAQLDTLLSMVELNNLVSYLKNNPTLKIQIEGHTDDVGTKESNYTLSLNRARVVHDFLLKEGIGKDRLTYAGFGEERPLDINDSAEGRKNNRRTSFKIIDK